MADTVTLRIACVACKQEHGTMYCAAADKAVWVHPCKALGGRNVRVTIATGNTEIEFTDFLSAKKEKRTGEGLAAT
jgi:histidinol-phosphate/aromatic aminotransferase/cobyric acid decarboxylase-like protein